MLTGAQPLACSDWAFAGHQGFDICQRLVVDEVAIDEGDLSLSNMPPLHV